MDQGGSGGGEGHWRASRWIGAVGSASGCDGLDKKRGEKGRQAGFQIAGSDNIVEGNESFPRMRKIEEESGLWVRFRFSFEAQF